MPKRTVKHFQTPVYAWKRPSCTANFLGEEHMDAAPLNSFVLFAVCAAVFFYILYGVVRAATRDGIIAARRELERTNAAEKESGR